MSNLRYNKKIKDETEAFSKLIITYTNKLKKEYEKDILTKQIKLLEEIAEKEDLDIIYLKETYLETTKKVKKEKETINIEEPLLEKITFKGKEYFYENKDNGNVYDDKSTVVGKYVDNEIKLKSKKSNNT
jgi:hypothetical protein